MTSPANSRRNVTFDLLRLLFASMVLLAHAFELTEGSNATELLHRLTKSPFTFGHLGVDGFFLLSGFLIVKSWEGNPNIRAYFEKRVLRIVPGYLVAAILSTVIVGLVAPQAPHFFRNFTLLYPASVLTLNSPLTPPVAPGMNYPFVNGSLWTIAYEFRCYLLVLLLGLIGVVRRPFVWLAITAVFLFIFVNTGVQQVLSWHRHILVFGDSDETFRLASIFMVGGCFYLFRDRIRFRPGLALLAALAILATGATLPYHLEPVIAVCGGYLLFYLGSLKLNEPKFMRGLPDISYGVYLYGWPTQLLLIWLLHPAPWITFLVSLLITYGLGWLSWFGVEKPFLKLKKKIPTPAPVTTTQVNA